MKALKILTKFAILLLITPVITPAWATIATVQHVVGSGTTCGSGTITRCTLTVASTGTGHVGVVVLGVAGVSKSITSVSDGTSLWSHCAACGPISNANGASSDIYWTSALASGKTSVTVNFTSSVSTLVSVWFIELSGGSLALDAGKNGGTINNTVNTNRGGVSLSGISGTNDVLVQAIQTVANITVTSVTTPYGILDHSSPGSGYAAFSVALNTTNGAAPTWTFSGNSQSVGASIALSETCGPPLFPCSSTSTANPGTITPLFNSTTPSGASSCSGDCQNTTKYDTTINPSGTDCITRITDGSVLGGNSMGNLTYTGGDNDKMWSLNDTYLGATVNGFVKIFQIDTSGNCAQVVNTGSPAINIIAPTAWSSTTDDVLYNLASSHILQSYTITNINSTPSPVQIFDFTASGNCPGLPLPMTITGNGIVVPSHNDSRFTVELQTGIQNTAIWVASYDTSLGCSTVNWQTGQVWGWCKSPSTCNSSTTPLGTFATSGDICWGANPSTNSGGIHDAMGSTNGDYYYMTINNNGSGSTGSWTQGACSGQNTPSQFISWQIGTLNNTWCSASKNTTNGDCGSHPSAGVTNNINPHYTQFNFRPLSNLGNGFTNIASSSFVPDDFHGGWVHPLDDDSYPWIGASDSVTTSHLSGCATSAVYCPTYPNDLIMAIQPSNGGAITVFAHTFACGSNVSNPPVAVCTDNISDQFGAANAIGNVSPDGKWFTWVSTMLHGMGNDAGGKPRADAFIIKLQ